MQTHDWFKNQQVSSVVETRVGLLKDTRNWETFDGGLRRKDRSLFEAIVVFTKEQSGRMYDKVFLRSVSRDRIHGVIILAIAPSGKILVQAKAEPGNVHAKGYVLLAPSVQSSHWAFQRNIVPLAELVNRVPKVRAFIPQDGGMFYGKINEYRIIVLDSEISHPENYRWVTVEEISQLASEDNVNDHLFQALGLLHLHHGCINAS